MSHIIAAKAKAELGCTLGASGAVIGALATGPVGAVVIGTFSGAFSVCLNGISKLGCHTYAKTHEQKGKLDHNMVKFMDENDRLIKGKIQRLFVGWNKLHNEVNHKISNLVIPLKFINPLPYISDKLFYHASIWVQTDLCENSDDGILIEYGEYNSVPEFNKEYPYPTYYYSNEYGLRYLRMKFSLWKNEYIKEKTGFLEDIFQHMELYFDKSRGITIEQFLNRCWYENSLRFTYKNYNFYTYNCQHFVATAIKVMRAKRYIGYNLRGNHNCSKLAIPKSVLDALESNENDATSIVGKIPILGSIFDLFNPKSSDY